MTLHDLKISPQIYSRVKEGAQRFVISYNPPHSFKVGDLLQLREFQPCQYCQGSGSAEYRGMSNGIPVSFFAKCGCLGTESPKGFYTGQQVIKKVTYLTTEFQLEGNVIMSLADPAPPNILPKTSPA